MSKKGGYLHDLQKRALQAGFLLVPLISAGLAWSTLNPQEREIYPHLTGPQGLNIDTIPPIKGGTMYGYQSKRKSVKKSKKVKGKKKSVKKSKKVKGKKKSVKKVRK